MMKEEHKTKEQLINELAEMSHRTAELGASETAHLSAEQSDKRAEEGLHIFKYMVENSIDAILMTDSDLQIVYSNRACNQLMAHNVIGQSLMALWFEEDLPLLDSIIEWAKVAGFFSVARLNGFHSVIDQYPGIEIVGTLAADWEREKGRQAAEEFLRANPPGTLDVIWAASGEMGLGAMLAVEAAGRQDEVKIFTNDVTPESADRMREGRLMAETHHGFPEWGWYGTKFAVMLALGQDVPPTFDIRPRTMYKDNADLFYPTPALEPIDWEGIKAGQELPQKIVIGWVQAAISGVFKTATEYFARAAADAREHGINVEVITRTPATPEDFAGQAAIIEDYIQRQVDVIILSTIKVEVIRRTIKKANQAGIPVTIVNQLEPIEGIEVACYIGFDNTVVGAISAHAVVDYLGGPGMLGGGEKVEVEPGTYLDLAWWQALYKDVDPRSMDVKGRVAIIEGISGSWHGENGLVRSDGSVVYADSITFPVHDEAGQFMGLVACFRDATQRKQAEEERERLQEQLIRQEKLAVLGQLAGGVGHELRNPLGAISNAVYFLNMVLEDPEPEVKETLEILQREVKTSERIISSLLDFARTKPPARRKVDINDLVQEVLSRAAVPGNVEVVRQLDETLPIILADPDQMGQVFGNITLNAIQAMPEGGRLVVRTSTSPATMLRTGSVEPSEVPSSDWVAISFTDTGVGIPEENLDKLFEPLFTTKAKGVGLGLAVSKTLVEGHGGTIEVESPSTEFTLSPALSEACPEPRPELSRRESRRVEGEAEGLGTGQVEKGTTFRVRLPISVG